MVHKQRPSSTARLIRNSTGNLVPRSVSMAAAAARSRKAMKLVGSFSLMEDLPDDIVINILGRMNTLTRIRFGAVSKSWKALLHQLLPFLPPQNHFPWLLTFKLVDSGDSIIISASSCTAVNQPRIKRQLKISEPVVNHQMLAVIFGWVVFEQLDGGILLYSPFNTKFLSIPNFPAGESFWWFDMSHTPTSSDCVFFAIMKSGSVCTCRLGDRSWRKHHDSKRDVLGPRGILDTVFWAGSFFIFSRQRLLAAFNVADESWWALESDNCDQKQNDDGEHVHIAYHLPNGGHLWSVVWWKSFEDCSVSKYDWLQMEWKEVKSLEGRVLFLNSYYPRGSIAIDATGELEGFADRIYFGAQCGSYFSLQDGKLHTVSHDFHEKIFSDPALKAFRLWITPSPPLMQL